MTTLTTHADFWVAPDGDDKATGAINAPFASLARARDAVQTLKATRSDDDIVVMIRGGEYRLTETVVFSPEDSAPDGHTITYAAAPGEEPVFSSGTPITGWRRLGSPPDALPEVARPHVWVADVPAELGRFVSLYANGERLPRARSKGFAPTVQHEQVRSPAWTNTAGDGAEHTLTTLHFPKGAMRAWPNVEDIEIAIIPIPWTMNILPLASVDEAAGVATTSVPGTAPLGQTRDWDESVWVENAIDHLDSPGEWVLDTREGKLYLWPHGDEPGDAITAPQLTELIRVEGDVDVDGPVDVPTRGIVFRGLTLTQGERDVWPVDHQGHGVQHDWELHDRATALLRFRGAEDCAVEECRFTRTSGTAVRLDLHCQRVRVERNLIEHIGSMGVLLAGYGPGAKDVNRDNAIVDNHIRRVGEIIWHGHAMMLWQSGHNRIAHNLIHHCPRKALSVSGVRGPVFDRDEIDFTECSKTIRWDDVAGDLGGEPANSPAGDCWRRFLPYMHSRDNVVEYNEVYRVLERLGDGAALNVSGAGTGNVLRRNYAHHIFNNDCSSVMRTDGWQCGSTFEENVIYRADIGGVTHKDLNHVVNNVLVDVGPKGLMRFAYFPGETANHGSRIERNTFYDSGAQDVYYAERQNGPPGMSRPEDCHCDRNVFYSAGDPTASQRALDDLQKRGIEQNSVNADPRFVDIENENFALRDNSPARALGVQSIDMTPIGLTNAVPPKFRTPNLEERQNLTPNNWRQNQTGARSEDNL